MKLELYNDINKFMDDTLEVLAENEIQNNIVISNCLYSVLSIDRNR